MAKKPKIEVDEDLMRQMIAGQAPLTSKVVGESPTTNRKILTMRPGRPRMQKNNRHPRTTGLNPGIGE